MIGETSFAFWLYSFNSIYDINANSIPVVIEYDSGIIMIHKNAGMDIVISFQSIEPILVIIEAPININTGATAAIGTHSIIG